MGKEMINNRLFQKYADAAQDEKFHLQRERLEKFYHDLHLKLKILLSEMEGDIRVLKEKGFEKEMWKIFVNVWKDLLTISHQLTPDKPYPAAAALVAYVKTRPHKAVIDNLDYLVQHFLKQNEVDFQSGPMLQQVQVRSLGLLKSLADHAEKYLADNPLLPVPSGIPPAQLPLAVQPEEFKPVPAGSEESTYLPPVKNK